MTKAEWVACTDPKPMLEFLCASRGESRRKRGRRRLRLFACACLRGIRDLLRQDGSKQGLECAERFADGLATEQELADAGRKGQQALWKERWSSDRHCSEHTYWQAAEAANHVTRKNYDGGDHPSVRHVAQSAATAWAFNLFYSRAEAKTARPRIKDDVLLRQAVHAHYLRDIFGSRSDSSPSIRIGSLGTTARFAASHNPFTRSVLSTVCRSLLTP